MTIKVFFDIAADGKELGRVTMELYDDVVPRTVGAFFFSFSLFPALFFLFPVSLKIPFLKRKEGNGGKGNPLGGPLPISACTRVKIK